MNKRLLTYIFLLFLSVPCIYSQIQGTEGFSVRTEQREFSNLHRTTLIRDAESNEFVIFNGRVIRKREFLITGGCRRSMAEYNRDRQATAQPSVIFTANDNQRWGFDAFNQERASASHLYPELIPGSGYRPPFKSVASFQTDRVNVSGTHSGTTFRTEWGIPANLAGDNELTIRGGGHNETTILYAFETQGDEEVVTGMLNILSFDARTIRVYIVSVNNSTLPNAVELQNELNRIFAPAVKEWEVIVAPAIYNVEFADGIFTHGGSGALTVYNRDQRAVINAFRNANTMTRDAFYLFFIDEVQRRDADGGFAGGYMPLGYQSGFIYGNPNAFVVAHELAHGAFRLYHTFSSQDFVAPRGTTRNLMDDNYRGGTDLWAFQWQLIHNPRNMWLRFLQDEEEGEFLIRHSNQRVLDCWEHTRLFNHVFNNNLNPFNPFNPVHFEIDDRAWISQPAVRNPQETVNNVIRTLRDTFRENLAGKIARISLSEQGIYIGSYSVNGVEYAVAIYSRRANIGSIRKIAVSQMSELSNENIKRHFRAYENVFSDGSRYILLAFFEEGEEEPALMIQIANKQPWMVPTFLEKWMRYLGIVRTFRSNIRFQRSVPGAGVDNVWERGRFDQLDISLQKAFIAFAQTRVGHEFLAQFAEAGDFFGSPKAGGWVYFPERGKNANIIYEFRQYHSVSNRWGRGGFRGVVAEVWINMHQERPIDDLVVTLAHEKFLHIQPRMDKMVEFNNRNDNSGAIAYFDRASRYDHLNFFRGIGIGSQLMRRIGEEVPRLAPLIERNRQNYSHYGYR